VIFVDISNKELLEQHLGDYATWMPYGFGERGMLGLYPTNEHSEEEIIEQLKKYKIPYYTEVTEAVVLSESGNDEADEAYKGIFIDRKTGDFKILTGRFPDKKAMINKYGTLGKDYIARKVFEKPVFDWILNNAKSSLDSYLMFSTAFSKWRHNSILDKYYIKLINDMPQLFKNVRAQDKIGGANKSKHADKEAIELDEADYVGSTDDITDGKIYLVVYGDNGQVLYDFTDSAPIKYSRNTYDFESVELFKWLQKAVDQVEEETGEKVSGVAVKKSKKDNIPKLYSRDQIEKGYTKSVGKSYSQDKALIQSPDQEKLKTLIYCKDEQGRRIIPDPYPVMINQVIEKGNGIDDRQVWISALQALNTVYGEPENTVSAQIYGPAAHEQVYVQDQDGNEYYSNRGEVYKNVHNMEPGQDKPFLTKSGKIAHPEWKHSNPTRLNNLKDLKNLLNNQSSNGQSIVQHMVDKKPISKDDNLGRLGDPAKIYKPKTYAQVKNTEKPSNYRAWRNFESVEEQKEQEMAIREEVKKLVEASGVFDLPDEDMALLANSTADNVIKFFVKNMFGKDDVEEVIINKERGDNIELEDFILPEVEAAVARIKARNPGKKVFVQVNDEKPTEYIDIEEPQE